MRTLSDTLKKEQQKAALNSLYKIVLTKGESSYTYEKDRILPSEHDEAIYSHKAKIVLRNHDHEFDDKNLKGYDAIIYYGFAGEYSDTAPLSVIDQQFDSDPNNLNCALFLEGIPNSMAEDEASASYLPEDDNEDTVKTLVNAIAGATLAPFTHCHAYEVVWDDGYDQLADSYKPKDGFRIYEGSSRLAALRKVLDYTANVPRFKADGKIHIMKPVTTGSDYDSEYSLQEGSHKFFSKAYRETLVFPNRFVVKSLPDDDPQYQGEAKIDGYDSLPEKVKKTRFVRVKLESNDQGDSIAEALLSKAELGSARGQAEIRINVGAEVFDYVKVTDSRQGDTRTGNLGYIHRRFGGKDKWMMTFGFGNWFDAIRYQKMLKELETYTDAGQYFSRLMVGDLYAEHILADNMDFVWIDPDNTIDLSKIGDNLDNLPDGEVYARVKTLHLDAGQIKLDENVLYSPGYNPTEKESAIPKQDTAPENPSVGDLWCDTSSTPNVIKRWTGSVWLVTAAQDLDDLPDGSLYQRVKSVALTASGLVVLDNVVTGTYGLVKSTDIYAGHIKLSTCYGDLDDIDDGSTYSKLRTTDIESGHIKLSEYTQVSGEWYDHAGVEIDANYGINIYGQNNALTTRATKTGAIQCYVGSDGAIYAGGGDVKLDNSGITIIGTGHLTFKYGSYIQGTIYGGLGALNIDGYDDVKIMAGSGHRVYLQGDYVDLGNCYYIDMPHRSGTPGGTWGGRLWYDTSKNLLCYYRSGVGWRIIQDNPY